VRPSVPCLLFLLAFGSCRTPPVAATGRPDAAHPSPTPYTLHFGDNGRLKNDDELKAVREDIAKRPQTVVVFLHGWKGTASNKDHSFRSFTEDLGKAARKPTGVYLTWNARHLPSNFEYLAYYPTRNRADAIAQGDGIFEAIRDLRKTMRPGKKEYLIIAGHSFGARILGRVVRKHPELLREVDLCILANAADDAAVGRETITKVNAHPYKRGRRPKLVWVTSEKDFVTRTLYKIAEGTPTIGHDESLQTHKLIILDPMESDPRKAAQIDPTGNRLGRYAHNIIVVKGLGSHSDVWGLPMIRILNEYLR